MILQAYSVYDKAVNAYMQPFYARSAGEALRSFMELANDTNTNVARHPGDFVLFAVGSFDDSNGQFSPMEPQRLVAAHEVVKDIATRTVDAGIERAQAMRSNGSA